VFPARANEIEGSLAAISGAGVDGLVLTDDGYLTTLGDRLAAFASEHRIPTLAGFRVREGILMSYSVDSLTVGRRAGDYVARILKGAHPADLPVEQIREFALRINLKTAKSLGLTIPFSLVAGADEVIE
jgi:putative ABC transport system substrate-binding protein